MNINNKWSKFLLIYSLLIVSTITLWLLGFSILRHTIYLSPLVLLYLVIGLNKKSINKVVLPFLLLIFISILYLVIFPNNSGFSQTYFLFAGISPFIIKRNFSINVKIINIFIIFTFILVVGKDLSLNFSLDSLYTSSTSSGENNIHPFLFLLLLSYFLKNKQSKWALVNFIFVILSFKRIVVISSLLLFIYHIIHRRGLSDKIFRFLLFMTVFIYLYITYLLSFGHFDNLIMNITGLSTSYFTMGRTSLYIHIFELIGDKIASVLFGFGPGAVTNILISLNFEITLIHNEILRIFFEYGLVVFFLFFLNIVRTQNIYFLIALIIPCFTDNLLMYSFFIFFYLLLQLNIDTSDTK